MKAILIALGFVALTAAFLGFAPLAPAQQPARMGAACATDAQTLCANVPRGPELHRCLAANTDKLSEGCRSSMGAMKAAAGEVRVACAGDFRQFCPTEQGPARMRCLRQNQPKLSQGCQSALAAMPGRGR